MRRPAIVWNQQRFDQLVAAAERAVTERRDKFDVQIEGHGIRQFSTHMAALTINAIAPDFAEQPEHYPENREGEEGQ